MKINGKPILYELATHNTRERETMARRATRSQQHDKRPMTLHWSFCLILLLLFFMAITSSANTNNEESILTRPNPYHQGCFYSLQNSAQHTSTETLFSGRRVFPRRVCNSEDGTSSSSTDSDNDSEVLCRPPSLPEASQPEIRILAANDPSALLQAWILQILTNELLGLPATIESGDASLNLNFYHPMDASEIPYVDPQIFTMALRQFMTKLQHDSSSSSGVMDCQKQTTTSMVSTPFASSEMCFHIMPQVWETDLKQILQQATADNLLDISSLGMLANQGWFLPKRTGLTAAFSLSYLGMSGATSDATEDLVANQLRRRRQLSEMFPTPLTWDQYCQQVSPTFCQLDYVEEDLDSNNQTNSSTIETELPVVAQRPPRPGTDEGDRMYVEGLYTGYFQILPQNNCTEYPTTCTGTLIDYRKSLYCIQIIIGGFSNELHIVHANCIAIPLLFPRGGTFSFNTY